ncbi:flippase activity-associated protein Agl23 [Candidatus Oscillochloris fontis]|uniref:flippase activity-associated protein Agl23 n=1 Tax=Candidatus Oscillochloris fontis TaxID=2496868 RepID=UPI00101DED4E|nr:flippase activity-associated protein Agl23 [Candidatus Oscillochloris fontis]
MSYTAHREEDSLLDHHLSFGRINGEVVTYILIVLLSLMAHLWGLDRMAMHHDESIHAWSSWRFYTGAGSFSCWGGATAPTYCYDPVYHGPVLYILTFAAYFLFGDGDAQARLPMALAGVGMVASAWWLRPLLGRRGALIAAALLAFSPSLLYFTRFARHDGLMVLWEIWMFIGAMRWLESGKARWLYLVAAAVALAIGTHELYYILFFIFGVFLVMRLLSESRFSRYLHWGLIAVFALCLVLMVLNPPLPVGQGLYLGEKAFLVASALALAWICQGLWDPHPLLSERLRTTWQADRQSIWVALAILAGIYLVCYTTFLTYPPGAIDGLYAGLAYWLGSQQEYARGDQPWYYYLMQLPLYEPLAVLSGFGVVVAMITAVVRRVLRSRRVAPVVVAEEEEEEEAELVAVAPPPTLPPWSLAPLLLTFWFFTAVILFSWAGEKMPWLLVHMALPGNLLAAWVLGRLVQVAHNPAQPAPSARFLIPIGTLLILISLGVAFWRAGMPATGQTAQSNLLQSLVPLIVAGAVIYGMLTIANQIGGRVVMALASLTIAGLIGTYTLRATWMAVYEHPDTPVELLVYTQTAPDVPRYVADIHELAINLTRNQRSAEDVAGEISLPIIIDSGDANGDGSLAWPLQWYLRDFKRLVWMKKDAIQTNPGPTTFEVDLPDGSRGLAPIVLLYKPHVSSEVRQALEANYVQPYGATGVFNWWFPEGQKCSPDAPGYKRFYYSRWTSDAILTAQPTEDGGRGGCGRDISAEVYGPLAPILWPFQRENWAWLYPYLIYRELPEPLSPGVREMEVWIRRDLAGGVGQNEATATASSDLRLVAQNAATLPVGGTGPTGAAVDAQGNLYIADSGAHQIHIFGPDGSLTRSFGSFGTELGYLYEPRGIAVDAEGNIYVADTWNARIVKYNAQLQVVGSWGSGTQDLGDGRKATITDGDPVKNAENPLGLFGPRGLALDAEGNLYIADTGNKRIVVTDTTGNYRYQWGYAGAELGAFNEPVGVAVDAQGNVYVADTWNSRVQVFAPDGTGQVGPIPIITWPVRGWMPNTYDDPAIAASPDGTIYVSIPSRQQVLAANLRGDVLLRWGGPGSGLAALNSPSGIGVSPDGSVWVIDRNESRALRFVLPEVQAIP